MVISIYGYFHIWLFPCIQISRHNQKFLLDSSYQQEKALLHFVEKKYIFSIFNKLRFLKESEYSATVIDVTIILKLLSGIRNVSHKAVDPNVVTSQNHAIFRNSFCIV